ncbi:MAG: choice-of-anchor D domain-containing protein [Acidobacteriales bacterium]|nr:choice-of-anchor D domain-containing protein [Terriglobales bacterium]
MMRRTLLSVLLLPLAALAELQLVIVDQGTERSLGTYYQVGATAVGDRLDLSFGIRNTGAAAEMLRTLSVSGVGFTLPSVPSLPVSLPAGAAQNFVVRFQPAAYGSYSANLAFNSSSTILFGTTTASATAKLVNGAQMAELYAGSSIDFGRVVRGARAMRRIRLENLTSVKLAVASIAVEGSGFTGPAGVSTPLLLEPQATAEFDITFEPAEAGTFDGVLRVDSRTFLLRGTGADPSLPKPMIELGSATPASSQQIPLAIRFASVAPASGTGELRVELRAATPTGADPAVLFPSTGTRFAAFTVKEGENVARFNGQTSLLFQTGTTAGTLVFTAKLGDYTETASATIVPAVVGLDSVRGLRGGSAIEVQITGYDNTRSLAKLAFTFYDKSSRAVQPGQMTVDVTTTFQKYFETSQKEAGGVFLLRAVFPVSGDSSGIGAVDVELTNSSGVARPARVQFP